VHAVAHWLTNDDIDLMIEIFPRHNFYFVFMIILFHYLLHHVDILLLFLAISIDDTVDLFTACFNSEK
jgi:hypothetical protein